MRLRDYGVAVAVAVASILSLVDGRSLADLRNTTNVQIELDEHEDAHWHGNAPSMFKAASDDQPLTTPYHSRCTTDNGREMILNGFVFCLWELESFVDLPQPPKTVFVNPCAIICVSSISKSTRLEASKWISGSDHHETIADKTRTDSTRAEICETGNMKDT
jgi:hypothetical protein